GMLTDKYLDGIPQESRAAQGKSLRQAFLSERTLANIRALDAIAGRRSQTLAQMALAWVLRKGRVTSALIGASSPQQVEDCVGALKAPDFTDAELAEIDQHAQDANINLWAKSAEREGPPRKWGRGRGWQRRPRVASCASTSFGKDETAWPPGMR